MLETERAELLPARETLGFVWIKNVAVVVQNQNNYATNIGGAYNTALAGGSQHVFIYQR